MLFTMICFLFIVISIFAFSKAGLSNPYTKGLGLAIVLSIVAATCLAQNYTQSLIPEANDGIGVSNKVANWIIGEDGWSKQKFRELFEASVYFTIILTAAYPVVLVLESKIMKKANSGA